MSETMAVHMARFYAMKVKRLQKDVRFVTAGQVASFLGVSRNTAKKNLANAVFLGYLTEWDFQHVNGARATAYGIPQESE